MASLWYSPLACAEFQGSIQLKCYITGIHQTDSTRQPKGFGWDVECVLKCGKQQEFVTTKSTTYLNLVELCHVVKHYLTTRLIQEILQNTAKKQPYQNKTKKNNAATVQQITQPCSCQP